MSLELVETDSSSAEATVNVADSIVEELSARGLRQAFGIISVHTLQLFESMRSAGFELIVPRHEQAAVHMADGFFRASRTPSTVITSGGPGASNATGGLYEAWASRSRVLHITTEISSTELGLGKGSLHETKDQVAMLGSVSLSACLCRDAAEVRRSVADAGDALLGGTPGPISVVIPTDLLAAEASDIRPTGERDHSGGHDSSRGTLIAVYDEAEELLRAAKRPLLLLGGGMLEASMDDSLRTDIASLAETLNAPVFLTVHGLGVVSGDHPLYLGPVMREGPVQALLAESDLMLAIGTRLRSTPTNQWRLRLPNELIQIDQDPNQIGKNYPVRLGIVDDAREAVQELHRRLCSGPRRLDSAVTEEVSRIRSSLREDVRKRLPAIEPFGEVLIDVLPAESLLVADTTIVAYQVLHQLLPVRTPGGLIFPTGYGIGPGLPLAIGAQLGVPNRRVVHVTGDGGMMLHVGELATVVQYNLPIVSVVFNDGGYGQLRKQQEARFSGRFFGVDLATPDFKALAGAFGIPATSITTPMHLRSEIELALARSGPTLIEVDLRQT